MVKKLTWSRGSGNKKYKVVIRDTKTKKKKNCPIRGCPI